MARRLDDPWVYEYKPWVKIAGRIGLIIIALGTALTVYSCNDDSSISDCSRRNLPQYYDRQTREWTCKPRE